MEPILSVRNLTKIFTGRKRTAVRAVDRAAFDLFPGECLGLIGESGCGKTTLAHMITRLVPPTEGQILFGGQDMAAAKGAVLRRLYRNVQMVFQTPAESFDPRRTLGDGIGEGLRNQGMPKAEVRAEVARLLERCGLDAEFAGRYPHQASGGQCQRAAVARAIAVNPRILICDEATSSLDVTVQAEITALLWQLRRERKLSCLFICHDIALVQSFCDRVLVMYRGKIVEQGDTRDVLQNPQDAYTRRLIASII